MKIYCDLCNQKFVNDFHLAAAHTKVYHELLEKIHEKIESLENDGRLLKMQPLELTIQELKSLLNGDVGQ